MQAIIPSDMPRLLGIDLFYKIWFLVIRKIATRLEQGTKC